MLAVFGDRIMKVTLKPKQEKVSRGWRKLHVKELLNLDASRNVTEAIK
jgi:hypothetical protein